MSTQFDSKEQAIGVFLSLLKVPVKREDLIEDPDLKVCGMEGMLLDDPDTSQEIKDAINAKIDAQQGFRAETSLGNISCVVGPFRDGFELWIISENGMAQRI